MSNKLTVCIINMATKNIVRARWVIGQLVKEDAVFVDIAGNRLLMTECDSEHLPALPLIDGSNIKVGAKGIQDCDVCIVLSDNRIHARVERKIDYIVNVGATPVHLITRGSGTNRLLIPIDDCDAIERYVDVCRRAGTHPIVYKNYYVEWEQPCSFDFGSDNASPSPSKEENASIEEKGVSVTVAQTVFGIVAEKVVDSIEKEITDSVKVDPPKVFIGGTTDFAGKLPFYWKAFLDLVMSAGSHILIGDAAGTDSCTQLYLSESYKDVEVCFSGESPCCNYGGWPSRHIWESDTGKEDGYWTSDMPKDMKMCELCDYGLFLWDGADMSVAKSMERLSKMHKKCIVCFNDYRLVTSPLNLTDLMGKMNRLPVAVVYDANGDAHFQLAVCDFLKRYEIGKIGLCHINEFKGLLQEYSYGLTN